jgi:Transposase
VAQVWVGVDAGKHAHHAAAVDSAGRVLWSMRVTNDQQALAEVIGRVAAGDEVVWAVDLVGCETALLRALLAAAGHKAVYVPGRTVKTMAGGFAGEAKTDARDAVVIANTARMRRDFLAVEPPTELVARWAWLVAHRADLVEDWVRTINRLRRLMVGIAPVLERALSFTNVATLILISGFQTPEQIKAAGRDDLIAYLPRHRAMHAAKVAEQALAAAAQQSLALPGQDTAADLAAELAGQLLQLHRRLTDADKAIEAAFAAIRRPTSSAACPAWAPGWPPSSPSRRGTCPPSPARTTRPPTPVLPQSPPIPAGAAATCAARSVTTAGCGTCSTCPPWPR